jgi:hypothetical protein
MQMKAIILTIFLLVSTANAQVSVSQEYLDDSRRAFIELRAEREVNKALDNELKAKNQLIEAQTALIESQKQQNVFLAEQNKALAAIRCDSTSFLFGLIKKKSCR